MCLSLCLNNINWDIIVAIATVINVLAFIILTVTLVAITNKNGKRQNKILQNTLKMELFEKRLNVYNAVNDIYAALTVNDQPIKNYYGVESADDLPKKLFLLNEKIIIASNTASYIFDELIGRKVSEVKDLYADWLASYHTMATSLQDFFKNNPSEAQKRSGILNDPDAVANPVQALANAMEECAPIRQAMSGWQQKAVILVALIKTSQILQEMGIYLNLAEIDKPLSKKG